MKPKILVAVDGSETSTKAVEHAGKVLSGGREGEITLYHIVETPPNLLERGNLQMNLGAEHRKWLKERRERAEKEIFAPAKQILKQKGIQEDTAIVHTRLAEDAHPDVALDIIQEAEAGDYDAVVMGRRGHSMLRDFVFGSVTCKVVHHIKNHAVWIVE